MTALAEMFASTSPIAIEEAREAAIPRERAVLERQLDETRAARQSLEADAIAAEKLRLAGSPDAPPDDDERDREIHRRTRREAAIAELLTEKNAELHQVRARIKALAEPRDTAVLQYIDAMDEAAMDDLRAAMGAARAALVKLLASVGVGQALLSRESNRGATPNSVQQKVILMNRLEVVARMVNAPDFNSDTIFRDDRLLSTEIISSIKKGTAK